MNTPEIVTREEVYAVYTQELGAYKLSSPLAWDRLTQQMNSLEKLFEKRPPQTTMTLGEGNAEALGICHDNPQEVDDEKMRYDAALVWSKEEVEELKNYDFETKTIAGGKYVKLQYIGISKSEESWYGLYAWIVEQGYAFNDEPAFEKYLNALIEPDQEKYINEIYVPIL